MRSDDDGPDSAEQEAAASRRRLAKPHLLIAPSNIQCWKHANDGVRSVSSARWDRSQWSTRDGRRTRTGAAGRSPPHTSPGKTAAQTSPRQAPRPPQDPRGPVLRPRAASQSAPGSPPTHLRGCIQRHAGCSLSIQFQARRKIVTRPESDVSCLPGDHGRLLVRRHRTGASRATHRACKPV